MGKYEDNTKVPPPPMFPGAMSGSTGKYEGDTKMTPPPMFSTASTAMRNNTSMDRMAWEHDDARQQLKLLTQKYGTPSHFSPKKGGLAIWDRSKLSGTCFERIELLDESVPHCAPSPHRDFLYTFINYEVPDDKVLDVISLSGSVAYDPLKKLLRARCGSEEANIATLYLATKIASKQTTLQEVQIQNMYKQAIVSTRDPQNVQFMLDQLCAEMQNQPGQPEWSGVFRLAFKDGCCKNYNPKLNSCGAHQPAPAVRPMRSNRYR